MSAKSFFPVSFREGHIVSTATGHRVDVLLYMRLNQNTGAQGLNAGNGVKFYKSLTQDNQKGVTLRRLRERLDRETLKAAGRLRTNVHGLYEGQRQGSTVETSLNSIAGKAF